MTILDELCKAHGQTGGTIHQFCRMYQFPFLHPNVTGVTFVRTKYGRNFRVDMQSDDGTERRSCHVYTEDAKALPVFRNNLQCDLGALTDWDGNWT